MATKTKAENPADAQPEVPQRDQVREQFLAGGEENTRSAIAKRFGLKYQQVYAMTKELGEGEGSGGRARVMVEWPKGSGEQRPRVEVIRELAQGIGTPDGKPMKIGPISRELGTSYQIVYQATRNLREDESSDDGEEVGEAGVEDVAEGSEEFDEDEEES
jgi:hypothetical protein